MKPWLLHAFTAMVFAGLTTVIAKQGLAGVSAELGIAVRTVFVFFFVMVFVAFAVPLAEIKAIRQPSLTWLAISAFTTAVSWIYFYKALTLRIVVGSALIVAGLVVISRR